MKPKRIRRARIIGLMSGTSHDGVDAALVEIKGAISTSGVNACGLNVKLLCHHHLTYNRGLREDIRSVFKGGTEEICRLNFKLGEVFAEAVLKVLSLSQLNAGEVDAVASHGQTVCHIPPEGRKRGATLQIGEASVIAEQTGVLTISDFRTRDMAAGGNGAPLVPVADYILFGEEGHSRAVLNIGGIANVTIIRGSMDRTIAFDTGPGNSLIDEAVRLSTGGRRSFDRGGSIASSGRPHRRLLNELLAHPFLKKRPPKSTGREVFGTGMVRDIFRRCRGLPPEDIISTLTHLTIISIVRSITPHRPEEVILTGGGVKNRFMTEGIRKALEDKGINVTTISEYGIPPEAKEAISFAILGYLTLMRKPGNLPSATGAGHGVILGKITLP